MSNQFEAWAVFIVWTVLIGSPFLIIWLWPFATGGLRFPWQ